MAPSFPMSTIGVSKLVEQCSNKGLDTEPYFEHWASGGCGLLADAREAWHQKKTNADRKRAINALCERLDDLVKALGNWANPLQSRIAVLKALVASKKDERQRLLQKAFDELATSAWRFQIPETLKDRLYLQIAGQSRTRLTNTSAFQRLDKKLPIRELLLDLANTHGWIHPAVLLLTETCAWVTGTVLPKVAAQDRRRVPISLVEEADGGGKQGRLAWLTVERIAGGTGALSPHPLLQAHYCTQGTVGSGHFLESLLRAWWRTVGYDLAEGREIDFDLWWSIESRDPGPQGQAWRPNLAGFSADVAIANALRAVREGVAVDGRIVVSASFASSAPDGSSPDASFPETVNPRESILPVAGLASKLSRSQLAAGETAPEVTDFVTSTESPWLQPSPKGGGLDGEVRTFDMDRKERSFGNGLTLIGVRRFDQQWDLVHTGAQITRKVKEHLKQRAELLLTSECGRFVEPHLLAWDPDRRWEGPAEGKPGQKRNNAPGK